VYKTKLLRYISEKTLLPLFWTLKIKPSYLVLFRVFFGILTAGTLFQGRTIISLVFISIYQIVFLLDYVDGKIARKRNEFSSKWRRFDRSAHYFISFLFLLGISYGLFMEIGKMDVFLIGIVGSLSILLTFLIDTLWLQSGINFENLKKIHDKKSIVTPIYSFLTIDGAFTLFYWFYLLNIIKFSIIFFSILKFLILIKKIYGFIKWKRKK
jgi:phosphatidylglycerophosphate synthase